MNIGQAADNSASLSCPPEITSSSSSPKPVLKPVSISTTIIQHLMEYCKFPCPFDWNYCKRALRTMGTPSTRLDLSRWFIAHIVVRMREICGLDEDTPLDNVFEQGTVCQATHEEYCEIYGMFKFLSAVKSIVDERQSIADFFICAFKGLSVSGMHTHCGVQCDIESQLHPVEMCTDAAHTMLYDCPITNDYHVCDYALEPS